MAFAHRVFVCFSVLPSVLLASPGFDQLRSSLLPRPLSVWPGKADKLTRPIVVVNHEAGFENVVDAFKEDWTIGNFKNGRIVEISLDKKLEEEAYRINFGSTVTVKASTRTGLAWALQTLGQLINSDHWEKQILDNPDVPFRSVSVDVARRFHSISTLKTLARWCQLGKVRFMQLHLTDDQNWMLPSNVFPHVDSRNQHHLPAYTAAELKDLQSFASARGVTIVPEIDIPGHCSLLVASDPKLFRIQNSASVGCVNFGPPLVRAKLKQLIGETARLFSGSPYIHIGGDEAWYPDAEKDPQMKAAMAQLGPNSNPSQVFVDFVGEMADEVIRLKKKPIVWEGFAASDFAKKRIPKETVVVAWEGTYYPADKLIADGYQVVNAGWDPYYVVNHFPYDSFTLVPLERLFRSYYHHFGIVSGLMAPVRLSHGPLLKGAMLCWWEGHEWNTQWTLPNRIVAFGSRLWNWEDARKYATFKSDLDDAGLKVMHQAYPFDFLCEGSLSTDESLFSSKVVVTMKPSSTNLRLAWRTDKKMPQVSDEKAENSVTITSDTVLSVQAYRGSTPVGETQMIPFHKVTVVPNLAFHCRVTTSCQSDPQFAAKLVTDGVSDLVSGFWLAYPNPQTLTIDLAAVKTVGRLEVVGFWATGAPTRYRLAVSSDGKNFTDVVDASKQTAPSTKDGYVHHISPVSARYIRIETLGSDLFPSTMTRINEIRAFEN